MCTSGVFNEIVSPTIPTIFVCLMPLERELTFMGSIFCSGGTLFVLLFPGRTVVDE